MGAVKSTYVEIEVDDIDEDGHVKNIIGREIFKNPITDDGTKKSAKGLLQVQIDKNNQLILNQQVSKEVEQTGLLQTIFENGQIKNFQTLNQIRNLINEQL